MHIGRVGVPHHGALCYCRVLEGLPHLLRHRQDDGGLEQPAVEAPPALVEEEEEADKVECETKARQSFH